MIIEIRIETSFLITSRYYFIFAIATIKSLEVTVEFKVEKLKVKSYIFHFCKQSYTEPRPALSSFPLTAYFPYQVSKCSKCFFLQWGSILFISADFCISAWVIVHSLGNIQNHYCPLGNTQNHQFPIDLQGF